jgi:uncharacterized protein (TIGR03437 family)
MGSRSESNGECLREFKSRTQCLPVPRSKMKPMYALEDTDMTMPLRTWILALALAATVAISRAQPLTTVFTFDATGGNAPIGPLVVGCDGNFYGTILTGPISPSSQYGAVFKLTPSGKLTLLHIFQGSDGINPRLGPFQASDGDFYGTTAAGGASGHGTVFKITPTGVITTVHNFSLSEGDASYSGVIQGTDGNFYGTTSAGGANGQGTIFKISPAGVFTTLHSFAGSEGRGQFGLVQGVDGNLYGTTQGFFGLGTGGGAVFKMTPSGALTVLYRFNFLGPQAGATRPSGLVQASDGNLYGTANAGETTIFGMVFKITPAGAFTTLHSFVGSDGAYPEAGVIQGSDGNFYGTTNGNPGRYGDFLGTIFKISPSGTLTTLYSFANGGGAGPYNPIVEGSDGNLYGTTVAGFGNVFKLQASLPIGTTSGGSSGCSSNAAPAITIVQNAAGGSTIIAPNTWVTIKGSSLAPAGDSRTWQGADFVNNQLPTQLDGVAVAMNGESAYVYYISPNQINVLTPPDLTPGSVQVQVSTSSGKAATFTVQAQQQSPSFFVFGGGPYVAATHADGTLIGPTMLYPNQSSPAKPGETILVYANGFGPTSVPVVNGSLAQSGSLSPLSAVSIGGVQASVQFAGLISPGLYQFNLVVPTSLPGGDQPIVANYGGLSTQAGALLTVSP